MAALSSTEGGKFSQNELMTSNWTETRDFKSESSGACTLFSCLAEFIHCIMLKLCPFWRDARATDSCTDMDIGGKINSRPPSAEFDEPDVPGAVPSRQSKTYNNIIKIHNDAIEPWNATLRNSAGYLTLDQSCTLTRTFNVGNLKRQHDTHTVTIDFVHQLVGCGWFGCRAVRDTEKELRWKRMNTTWNAMQMNTMQ